MVNSTVITGSTLQPSKINNVSMPAMQNLFLTETLWLEYSDNKEHFAGQIQSCYGMKSKNDQALEIRYNIAIRAEMADNSDNARVNRAIFIEEAAAQFLGYVFGDESHIEKSNLPDPNEISGITVSYVVYTLIKAFKLFTGIPKDSEASKITEQRKTAFNEVLGLWEKIKNPEPNLFFDELPYFQ